MHVSITSEPCLLYEAMELTFSYVNETPVEQFCGAGEYAIPPEIAVSIRDAACKDIDRDDPMVQFFFRSIYTKHGTRCNKRDLCMASHILYGPLIELRPDIESQIQSLLDNWNSIERPYAILEMDNHCLSIDTATEMTSLSSELAKLPFSLSVQNQFMDVIYNYEQHLMSLTNLLKPVIEALKDLLDPWVNQAKPLLNEWRDFLSSTESTSFFLTRMGINGLNCENLALGLRYFPATGGYMKALPPNGPCCILCGLDMKTSVASKPDYKLTDSECKMLQLMSNPDRISMLCAMIDTSKCGQDLVRELGLHTGVVFRDLNNMTRAGLLNREVDERKSTYRTNIDAIRDLAHRILLVFGCESDSSQSTDSNNQ